MRVIVRAFNKDGYHRDIAIMSEQQVHQNDTRIEDAVMSVHSGLIGVGVAITPEDFPEVVRFEVVIRDDK
jgi:hypothetical protein